MEKEKNVYVAPETECVILNFESLICASIPDEESGDN